jgi:hypothetical protein
MTPDAEHLAFMAIVTGALKHQADAHGGVVFMVDANLCPDSALYATHVAAVESAAATKH